MLRTPLASPKLPLFPKEHSLAAFVAFTSETCAARPVRAAPFARPFVAFSAAEPVKAAPLIYREKELFDCLRITNATISVALAVLPAVGAELLRANIIPSSSLAPLSDDEEPPPLPDPEPFDWLLMLQNASLALARDLLSKIVQQFVEIRAKLRVPKWVHDELIKHVPSFAEVMRGSSKRAGRLAASRAVVHSGIPYASRYFGLFVADALLVDAARLWFPASARTRLQLTSSDPAVGSFTTNLKLKLGKHVLAGCLSYSIGVIMPLVLVGNVPYFIGFMLGDVVAVLVAEAVVAEFGEVK